MMMMKTEFIRDLLQIGLYEYNCKHNAKTYTTRSCDIFTLLRIQYTVKCFKKSPYFGEEV
jgi:hypothetical protein